MADQARSKALDWTVKCSGISVKSRRIRRQVRQEFAIQPVVAPQVVPHLAQRPSRDHGTSVGPELDCMDHAPAAGLEPNMERAIEATAPHPLSLQQGQARDVRPEKTLGTSLPRVLGASGAPPMLFTALIRGLRPACLALHHRRA